MEYICCSADNSLAAGSSGRRSSVALLALGHHRLASPTAPSRHLVPAWMDGFLQVHQARYPFR